MKNIKAEWFGEKSVGLVIRGDRRNPEPEEYRIRFPGGFISVVRAQDVDNPDYWVHMGVNRPDDVAGMDDEVTGRLVDGRIDSTERATHQANLGDLLKAGTYHFAIRVKPAYE